MKTQKLRSNILTRPSSGMPHTATSTTRVNNFVKKGRLLKNIDSDSLFKNGADQ